MKNKVSPSVSEQKECTCVSHMMCRTLKCKECPELNASPHCSPQPTDILCECHCHTNHNGLDGTNGKARCKCLPRCVHCVPTLRTEPLQDKEGWEKEVDEFFKYSMVNGEVHTGLGNIKALFEGLFSKQIQLAVLEERERTAKEIIMLTLEAISWKSYAGRLKVLDRLKSKYLTKEIK